MPIKPISLTRSDVTNSPSQKVWAIVCDTDNKTLEYMDQGIVTASDGTITFDEVNYPLDKTHFTKGLRVFRADTLQSVYFSSRRSMIRGASAFIKSLGDDAPKELQEKLTALHNENLLTIPLSALQKNDDAFSAWVIEVDGEYGEVQTIGQAQVKYTYNPAGSYDKHILSSLHTGGDYLEYHRSGNRDVWIAEEHSLSVFESEEKMKEGLAEWIHSWGNSCPVGLYKAGRKCGVIE